MAKKINSRNHTVRILWMALLLLLLGFGLISLHWSGRPLQMMRAERTFDTLMDGFRYGSIKGEKLSDSKAQEVPILLYHGILDGPDDGFSITKSAFIDQMLALKKAGYSTVTTDQYLNFIEGKEQLPEKSIMITFDDGRKDSFYRADSILKALDFKAVMYLTSGYSIVDGSKYYVDKDELKVMQATGRWDIEAHADYAGTNQIVIDNKGTTENFFGYLKWLSDKNRRETIDEYRQRVKKEFSTAKQLLGKALDEKNIRTLSFPFGDYGQHYETTELSGVLLDEAAKYYDQVYVQFRPGEPYSSNYFGDNDFMSRRIEVQPSLGGKDLVTQLGKSIAKPSQFKAKMNDGDGWRKEWGIIQLTSDGLSIKSENHSTTAAVYLDGTKKLKRYSTSTRISDLPSQTTNFELAAGYRNKNNYVGCVFYADKLVSESVVGGIHYKIAEVKMQYGYRNNSLITTEISDNTGISCKVNDATYLSSTWDLSEVNGGPAIFVRNSIPGTAAVTLSEFEYNSENSENLNPLDQKSAAEKSNTYLSIDFNDPGAWKNNARVKLNTNDNNFSIEPDPSGKNGASLKAFFSKGSYSGLQGNTEKSATIFKIPFAANGISGRDDVYLQYQVMFEEGFAFNKAGVLPGLGGGTNNTGGNIPNGYDGWSSRLMWRGNKLGNYSYLPKGYEYGQQYPGSTYRNASTLTSGKWQCVTLHVRLNEGKTNNGLMETWLDGSKILQVGNLRFRYDNSLKINDILFEAFFGGRNESFASPKDQSAYFDNITLSDQKLTCELLEK
ncbi:MAG: hypothetical protein JWM00_186 [Candidatus Saccharibacteria bacterium]|nr:hypothetical protein [Candidatus Saccharibacteria bacterium]